MNLHCFDPRNSGGRFLALFQRSWLMLDDKTISHLWNSYASLLIVIIILTIVPGLLHRLSGQILRWPILALTYLSIATDLTIYTALRLFIRCVETVFSTHKHRALRKQLEEACSYEEWHDIALALDKSQQRDLWQQAIDDDTSFKFNWAFIKELMVEMAQAREAGNILDAISVLQNCTRKNVGGILSEELFSHTNTGDPKFIVIDFLEEVMMTIRWITHEVIESDIDIVTSEQAAEALKKTLDSNVTRSDEDASDESNKHILNQVLGTVAGAGSAVAGWALHTAGIFGEDKNKNIKVHQTPPLSGSHDSEYRHSQMSLRIQQRNLVKSFLKRARAAYGRTALCLSGGAMMGNYHFGHVKALLACNVLPHIISGTSAGSVVAAFVCTRTDAELERDLKSEVLVHRQICFSKSWPDCIRNAYAHGCLFDSTEWLHLIEWFTCGKMTFEEAYKKTGRILCITLSATTKKAPPVLINYISAPNVTIASAVVASAAVPGFIKPVILQVKGRDGVVRNQSQNFSYCDGSIDQDIPTSGLAEMFNCQFFLAAQCNPHIAPFFFNTKGDVGRPNRWMRGTTEHSWRGGFLLAALEIYLKYSMRAKFHFLNDLEAAIGFTSTMMTQTYGGSTTIVPRISFQDYFKLFSNPTLDDLNRYIQVGSVAAYQHVSMMKLHYSVSRTLDECLAIIEEVDGSMTKPRRRQSLLHSHQLKNYSLTLSSFPPNIPTQQLVSRTGLNTPETESIISSNHDDEHESGFDGLEERAYEHSLDT